MSVAYLKRALECIGLAAEFAPHEAGGGPALYTWLDGPRHSNPGSEPDRREILYIGKSKTEVRWRNYRRWLGTLSMVGLYRPERRLARLQIASPIVALLGENDVHSHVDEVRFHLRNDDGGCRVDVDAFHRALRLASTDIASAIKLNSGETVRVPRWSNSDQRTRASGAEVTPEFIAQWLLEDVDFFEGRTLSKNADSSWEAIRSHYNNATLSLSDLECLMVRIGVRSGMVMGNSQFAGQWESRTYGAIDTLAVIAVASLETSDRQR